MEKNITIKKGANMKKYVKPSMSDGKYNIRGLVPAAVAGLSAGGAFVAGVAAGLMKDNRESNMKIPSLLPVILNHN